MNKRITEEVIADLLIYSFEVRQKEGGVDVSPLDSDGALTSFAVAGGKFCLQYAISKGIDPLKLKDTVAKKFNLLNPK